MIDKLLKSRKDKKSDCCNRIIKSGEMYNKIAFKAPKFGEDDLQIGVEFVEIHVCIDCYNEQQEKEKQCKCNNHSFVEIVNTSYSFNGVSHPEYTDEFVCENCGISQKDVELQSVG
jgi:hypothetical protein